MKSFFVIISWFRSHVAGLLEGQKIQGGGGGSCHVVGKISPDCLKLRFSQKATIFWKNLPIFLTFLKDNGRYFFLPSQNISILIDPIKFQNLEERGKFPPLNFPRLLRPCVVVEVVVIVFLKNGSWQLCVEDAYLLQISPVIFHVGFFFWVQGCLVYTLHLIY